jgi:hypothetical protein
MPPCEGVALDLSRPGMPTDKADVEAFGKAADGSSRRNRGLSQALQCPLPLGLPRGRHDGSADHQGEGAVSP